MDRQILVSFIGPANAVDQLDGGNISIPRVGDTIDWFGTRYRVEEVTHVFRTADVGYDDAMLDRIEVRTGLAL